MQLLYNLFIELFHLGLQLASLFNPKAAAWKKGRKNLLNSYKEVIPKNQKLIWFHCASLGEFEQARPLIEAIKSKHSEYFILLTFFSPSGYEIQKKYSKADFVGYMPLDRKSNAKAFLDIISPELIIFVKYEFWFNHLQEIKSREISCLLLSGIFWKQQQFFQFYGQWFAARLKAFSHFFVQNEVSKFLLSRIGYKNVTVAGDSRFDRVFQLSKTDFNSKRLSSFRGEKTVVFGSSWEKENQFASKIAREVTDLKLIIAPHEIKTEQIQKLKQQFESVKLWSESEEGENLANYQVLIIDTIGLLSKLYRYGDVAIIGGGFGSGIHNTLEAAVYGCPVIFGPNYQRFQEAKDLIKAEAAFQIESFQDLKKELEHLFNQPTKLTKSSKAAADYVSSLSGATAKVMTYLEDENLLAQD